MNFIKAFRILRQTLPFFKSVIRAYKQTTGGNKPNDDGSYFGKYFSKVMTQSNLGAPPLTQSTALQILNIQKNLQQVTARQVLQRYYVLFKKNDPKVGGTTYLQSKVFASKQLLMARFPDAVQQQQLFYKQVVQPQQKAQQQARKAEQDQKASVKTQQQQKLKKKQQKKQ